MEKETGNWKQRMSNAWWKGWGCFSPCSLFLRVISIKFLLVIPTLCETEWSWELRTWSHKMNLLDILSTSPHYFCRKWTGVTNDNSNFDLGVFIPRSCSHHPFSNIHCVILRAASLSIKRNEREKKKATPAAGGTMKRTRSYPAASRSCLACYSLLTVKKYKRLLVVLNS